jgi:MFS family permease
MPGYILQKVGVAKWLGANVILWGIATACHAAAFNYHSLLAARIFLGMFEAAIAPCLMLISSQWYTKSEQAPRFSFWYCGLGTGQILGGLISYAFQHVKNPSFAGWKMMFIVMGLVTALIGAAALWILPDTPMKAKFLSDAEKTALLNHVSVNQTGIQNTHFKLAHLKEIIMDIQIWLMVLITVLVSVSIPHLLFIISKYLMCILFLVSNSSRSLSPRVSSPPTLQHSSMASASPNPNPPS